MEVWRMLYFEWQGLSVWLIRYLGKCVLLLGTSCQVYRWHGAGRCNPHCHSDSEGGVSSFRFSDMLKIQDWYFAWSTDQSCHLNILNPIFTNSALTWSADSKVRFQERTLKLESLMRSEYSSMPLHHCISGSSIDVNAQGPGFLKEAGMISGNVIVVGFVPENCFPLLVVVWLPLSKSIYCS